MSYVVWVSVSCANQRQINDKWVKVAERFYADFYASNARPGNSAHLANLVHLVPTLTKDEVEKALKEMERKSKLYCQKWAIRDRIPHFRIPLELAAFSARSTSQSWVSRLELASSLSHCSWESWRLGLGLVLGFLGRPAPCGTGYRPHCSVDRRGVKFRQVGGRVRLYCAGFAALQRISPQYTELSRGRRISPQGTGETPRADP